MDFNKMTLTELETELNNYRNQLETQGYQITPAQKRRWEALKHAYKTLVDELAK